MFYQLGLICAAAFIASIVFINLIVFIGGLGYVSKMTGDDVRAIRKRLKLTQTEFARRLGRSQQSVCHLETGKYAVERETALAMMALEAGLDAALDGKAAA